MSTSKKKRISVEFLSGEESNSESEEDHLIKKERNEEDEVSGDQSGDGGNDEVKKPTKRFKTVKQIFYDCPTCPEVKDYDCADYATHLGIHQRRPYQCQVCFEFLQDDSTSWEAHQKKHSGHSKLRMDWSPGLIYKCEGKQCLGFTSESERDLHEQTCSRAKVSKQFGEASSQNRTCNLCSKLFRNGDEWRFHRVLEHPEVDRVSCPFCSESFLEKTFEGVEDRNDMKLHDHIHSSHYAYRKGSKLYENCESCGLVFPTIKKTLAHFKEKHKIEEGCYICRICQRGLHEPESLRRHMQLVHFRPTSLFCELCGETLKSETGLLEHKFRKHQINEKNLLVKSCRECSYQCLLPKTLNTHEQNNHKKKDNVCEECGKKFLWISELHKHHLIAHLGEAPTTTWKTWNKGLSKPKTSFSCPSCPEVKNYTLVAFAQHLHIHRQRPFKCTNCGEFLPNDKSSWEGHWISQHSLSIYNFATEAEAVTFIPFNPGPVFKCGGCKERFSTEMERDAHSKGCTLPGKSLPEKTCGICQKQCKIEEWRIHRVLNHPEVDWLSCPFCDERFTTKLSGVEERHDLNLFKHLIQAHPQGSNDTERFRLFAECLRCGIIFKSEKEMKAHFETKHGIKDFYVCRLCDARLPDTRGIERHLRTVHFTPEGFPCKVTGCGAKFQLESTLIDHNYLVHKLLPQGEYKMKECTYPDCEFKCFFAKQMINHKINHQPLDKICEVCGRGFRRAGDLRKHVELHKEGVEKPRRKRKTT